MSKLRKRAREIIVPLVPRFIRERNLPDDETITRFVFHSKLLGKKGAKYGAFMDNRDPSELSVFKIANLISANKLKKIWSLAKYIRTDKPPKARCDLNVGVVKNLHDDTLELSLGLRVVTEPTTHCRHVNISDIPVEDAQRQLAAQALANKACTHLYK